MVDPIDRPLGVPKIKKPRLSTRCSPRSDDCHSKSKNPKIVVHQEDETDDVFYRDEKENRDSSRMECSFLSKASCSSMASSPPSPNMWNALSVESPVRRKLQAIGLRKCLEDSNSFCTLGQGGFGTVVFGTWKSSKVAIKILDQRLSHQSIKNELNAERLDHQNIVKILKVFTATEEQHSSLIIMEYVGHYNLRDVLQNQPSKCSQSFTIRCLLQLSSALQHCHERGVVHLDVKPANVLVIRGSTTVFKLADFGCSRPLDEPCSNVGTPGYQGPETLQTDYRVTSKSDVYSFGVVLWQLLSKDPIVYPNVHPHTIIFQVATNPRFNPEFVSNVDTSLFQPQLRDLYRLCWQNVDERPSADAIIMTLKSVKELRAHSSLSVSKNSRKRSSSLRI